LETRMTADISIILQLLQRQAVPVSVPPAYSAVSPASHPTDMYSPLSTELKASPSAQPVTPLAVSPLEVPCYFKREKQQISQDSVSVGAQLTAVPDQTLTRHPQSGHEMSPPLRANLQRPTYFSPARFHSLPEHLESSSTCTDIKRHVSDPVLPGS
ncbi:hypothetical protein scyTo_0020837, partial [Scyliorhinus torazame]|nr:hypothetical protein [Scyliorhinus torazame]